MINIFCRLYKLTSSISPNFYVLHRWKIIEAEHPGQYMSFGINI